MFEVQILQTNERGYKDIAVISLDNDSYGLWLRRFDVYNDAYNFCKYHNFSIRNEKSDKDIIFTEKPVKFNEQLGIL